MTQRSLNPQPLLKRVTVKDLFGARTYVLGVPTAGGGPGRLALLHGDNGTGKTTILHLIWNALSAANNRGHRTFLAETPFAQLEIDFTSGASLRVKKRAGLLGAFDVRVKQPGKSQIKVRYDVGDDSRVRSMWDGEYPDEIYRLYAGPHQRARPKSDFAKGAAGGRVSVRAEQEGKFLAFLRAEVGTPLFLKDDRSLGSDDPDIERMRAMLHQHDEPGRRDQLQRLVILELEVTLRRVNEFLTGLTLGGQADGSSTSNALYMDVLLKMVNSTSSEVETNLDSLRERIREVSLVAPEHEKYGLMPPLDFDEFTRLLNRATGPELQSLVQRVFEPYVSSLEGRLAALKDAYSTLDALVPTLNSFFEGKSVEFSPRNGLEILAKGGGALPVASLSSGERHLLALLLNTLLARKESRLFLIDEPELSLGVDWQRRIIRALMELTQGTVVQFVVATHSIEIVTSEPEALVRLE